MRARELASNNQASLALAGPSLTIWVFPLEVDLALWRCHVHIGPPTNDVSDFVSALNPEDPTEFTPYVLVE